MRLNRFEKGLIAGILMVALFFLAPLSRTSYTGPEDLEPPVQVALVAPEWQTLEEAGGSVELEMVATYSVRAGVRSVRRYRWDASSRVSPVDLVLAWGTLNQPSVDRTIRYRQSGRWYFFSVEPDAPVSTSYISRHSANTHMIPADRQIARKLSRIRRNDLVELNGYLVNVHFDEGTWRTSLRRDDTGAGACEIFYVTGVLVH